MADEATNVDEPAAGETAAQAPEAAAAVADGGEPAAEADQPAAADGAVGTVAADGTPTGDAAPPEGTEVDGDATADEPSTEGAEAADVSADDIGSFLQEAGQEAALLPEMTDEIRRICRLQVPVIVKLAEKQLALGEIVDLSMGSIVEFSKNADMPLELLVNNKVIARGTAVKVGEKFGLRIDEILPVEETIRSLGA